MEPEVWIERERVYLRGGMPRGGDRLHRTVSRWPGWRRIRGQHNAWSLFSAPLITSALTPLLKSTLPMRWRDGADRRQIEERLKGVERAIELLHPPPSASHSIQTRTDRKPRPHQTHAVLAIEALDYRVLLGDEMGLGKSSTALWAVERSACTRLLIVCPKSVMFNWPREALRTVGRPNVFPIHGTPKKRGDQFGYLVRRLENERPGELDIVILTWGVLRHLPDQHTEILEKWVDDQAVILDESQHMKGARAQRTRYVLEHLTPPEGGARVRLLLSGTPIMNTLEDLWSQIQAVRPGTWTSRTDFVTRYIRMAMKRLPGKGGKLRNIQQPVGSKNVEELNGVLRHVLIRREKEDELDLPPKIRTVVELELEGAELAIYKAMKEEAIVKLEELDDEMTVFHPEAKNAVEAALRCEQIAQGFVGGIPSELLEGLGSHLHRSNASRIPHRPGELLFPRSPKIAWLLESVADLGKPCVVFSRFNAPLFWLRENIEHAEFIHGQTQGEARQAIIDDFQAGHFDVLLCQVKLGIGFTLTRAHDIFFLGRDWSPAVNVQAEDRCHRIGTRGTVNIQIPVVRNTIEKMIHKRLAAKAADAQQALRTTTIRELMEAL